MRGSFVDSFVLRIMRALINIDCVEVCLLLWIWREMCELFVNNTNWAFLLIILSHDLSLYQINITGLSHD